MVKYVKARNTRITNLGEDLNLESDCEDSAAFYPVPPEETHAVLITGSFSARVHFLAPMLMLK